MKRIKALLKRLHTDERGVNALTYLLVAAFVATIAVYSMGILYDQTVDGVNDLAGQQSQP